MRRAALAGVLLTAAMGACRSSSPQVGESDAARLRPIEVVVLTCDGCAQTDSAIATIDATAKRIGIPVEVRRITVATAEDARRRRFLGSPTVQIKGRDVDPAARERSDFGLG
jgi:hypothetical protein